MRGGVEANTPTVPTVAGSHLNICHTCLLLSNHTERGRERDVGERERCGGEREMWGRERDPESRAACKKGCDSSKQQHSPGNTCSTPPHTRTHTHTHTHTQTHTHTHTLPSTPGPLHFPSVTVSSPLPHPTLITLLHHLHPSVLTW